MGCTESTPYPCCIESRPVPWRSDGPRHKTPDRSPGKEKPRPPALQIIRRNAHLEKVFDPDFKQYTLAILKAATNGFSPGNVVQETTQHPPNSVYRGRLVEEGRWVAIKRFPPGAWPDAEGFISEASRVGTVRHEKLVSLIGYCCEGDERLLVAEFMPNDTLAKHLFQWEQYPMDWDMRVRVALYVIRALNHCTDNGLPIYHDLNACRVLFDHDRLPRLSCFGLMKASRDGLSYSSSLAYVPPECIENGKVVAESVVYSYGTLLLDLISGKHIPPSHAVDLILAKDLPKLMDSCLEAQFSDPDGEELVRIAAMCLQYTPKERPTGKAVASLVSALRRRSSSPASSIIERRPSDSRIMPVGEELSPHTPKLTPLGECCLRNDLTAMHGMLVEAGYKHDEGTDNELSFQVWIKMQETLNARKRGDVAFLEKDFKVAIDCYTEFVDLDTMKSPTVYARRALAYLFTGELQKALWDAMKAEIIYPKWHTAFYMQSLALTKMGMETDAKDMLKEGTILEIKKQKKQEQEQQQSQQESTPSNK